MHTAPYSNQEKGFDAHMQYNTAYTLRIQLVAAIQEHNELFALTAEPTHLAELADSQEEITQDLLKEMDDEANAIKAAMIREREDADAEQAVLDKRIAELQDQWAPWKEELSEVMFASW